MRSDQIHDWLGSMIGELSGVPADAVRDEAYLLDDLGMDSLGVAELYARAEARFGIRVEVAEAKRCERVGEIRALIASHVRRAAR